MTLIELPLGDRLLQLARGAERELILCSPFAKRHVVQRILTEVRPSVQLYLFTRWRPEEVAAGVSDTGVLDVLQRQGGRVLLHDRLHAKYYRGDEQVLIGSANLTGAALGWSDVPNLEILSLGDVADYVALEERLFNEAIEATEELAVSVDKAVAQLPSPPARDKDQLPLAGGLPAPPPQTWMPRLRQPEDLFVAYKYGVERLSSASGKAAGEDLQTLEPPSGLSKGQFYALIASRLLQQPIVSSIEAELQAPRRFGHLSAVLGDLLSLDARDADLAWQTLMRWLLEFLPDRYRREVGNWSEVFRKAEA